MPEWVDGYQAIPPTLISVNLRIGAPTLDFHVDVRLRNFDRRWLAVAEIGGEQEVGLGSSPREALAASLASLGAAATAVLLADPKLVDVTEDVS